MLKLKNLLKTSQNAGGFCRRNQFSIAAAQQHQETRSNVENFADLQARRQSEALRSVMLQIDSKDVCGQVYHHCKQYGDIKNAFVYAPKDQRNLMLIEYDNVDSVKEAFKFTGFQPNTVNWRNRVLSVRKSKLNPSLSKDAPFQIENDVIPSVIGILRSAQSFDDQVNLLYEQTRLTDLSVRLKYITAMQSQVVINEFLESIFPNAKVYPFGSSVNGLGKIGCDLDMVLRYDELSGPSDENDQVPLAFQGHGFENAEDMKRVGGSQVRCIASLIDYFVPGSTEVAAIAARVPIVRYFDTNISNSVDLSVNNLDSFHITEYMYAMGMLDTRVRPFIFMVRNWAKEFELKRNSGRDNFTNFQISYMCLSFLQQLKDPVVPTFEDVMRNESKNVGNLVKDTFIFNVDQFQFKSKNTDTILELFKQFLVYFESYNFEKYAVTVRTTEKMPKPGPTQQVLEKVPNAVALPLYLENIFDISLPWGGNVSDAETSTLKIMCRETLQKLEQSSMKSSVKDQDWGLLKVITKLK